MCSEIEKDLFKILVLDFLPSPTMAFDKEIDRVENMKISLRTKDHNSPHFHIDYKDEISAYFSLDDATYLKGDISQKKIKVVQKWFFAGGKEKLLKYKKTIESELR